MSGVTGVAEPLAWMVQARIGEVQVLPSSSLQSITLILSIPLAKMLSWFIQHFPTAAQWYIGEIMGEANKQLDIPAQVTGEALRRSATTNGDLDQQAAKEFFSRVVPRQTEN
jgi:hypothetical protein